MYSWCGRSILRQLLPAARSSYRVPLAPRFATKTLCRYYSTDGESSNYILNSELRAKAQALKIEYKQLSESLVNGYDDAKMRQHAKLESLINYADEYEKLSAEVNDLQELSTATDEDSLQLRDDALLEMEEIKQQMASFRTKIERLLIPSHPFAHYPCIMEFRPGIGGSEAAIFTKDLLEMYQNYCQAKKWKYSILEYNPSGDGSGILEGILVIEEPGSYERLRFEGGVHRVQRIPDTETKGRMHTSTTAIVVMPQLDAGDENSNESERSFAPGEVRVDIMRARGAGGQHVNTTDSAVRLTHIPTGIVVAIQDARSQHKNKAKAYMILRGRLAEKEYNEKVAEERKARTSQVTSTDRSDKLRTYNYPQNRVTDHRCGFTMHDLSGCMDGSALDTLLDKVQEWATNEEVKNLQFQ
ncbi:uncharacterized protein V2V93DRAFT_341389 [Kockiozyma suomiensis]|uniref:uncharacterized protein n=1 Tax=Kockiozyma suomiensis TaxID=1337062 RepID=UPI0033436750